MNEEKTAKRDGQRAPDIVLSDGTLVEVKTHLAATRGLRDALVRAAKNLVDHPEARAYVLLIDPRLSRSSIAEEYAQLRSVLRPEIAKGLCLVVTTGGEPDEDQSDIPPDHWASLKKYIKQATHRHSRLPRPDMKFEVFKVFLHHWFLGRGPLASYGLAEMVGCNYRTVAATLELLGPAVERLSDRSAQLKYFPQQAWSRFLADPRRTRGTLLYTDRSDQPRSAEALIRRLRRQALESVAVGGVLGAKRSYPDLDLVGAPRLDLCIHAPGAEADLSFLQQLDPALQSTRDSHTPVRLAVHFIRRADSFFDKDEDGLSWADPVECLADLYEMRLDSQTSSFLDFLSHRAEALSGED